VSLVSGEENQTNTFEVLLGGRLHSKLIVSMSGHHTSGEVTLLFPSEHFIGATFYLSIHNIISRVLILTVCKPQGIVEPSTLIPPLPTRTLELLSLSEFNF